MYTAILHPTHLFCPKKHFTLFTFNIIKRHHSKKIENSGNANGNAMAMEENLQNISI